MYITPEHLVETGRTPGSILMEAYKKNLLTDRDLPWLNLGYWSDGCTYQQACQNLAQQLGILANLENCSKVLDAGSGYCAPAIYWAKHYPNITINCLNIFADQIREAQTWIKQASLSHRIVQHQVSATETSFSNALFDAVIALESAFHFHTRNDFFKEAYRVLRPGGILVLADMVPSVPVSKKESGYSNIGNYNIPQKNLICSSEYINELEYIGFKITFFISIRSFVYPYFHQFISALSNNNILEQAVYSLNNTPEKAYNIWRKIYCLDDFILLSAVRGE